MIRVFRKRILTHIVPSKGIGIFSQTPYYNFKLLSCLLHTKNGQVGPETKKFFTKMKKWCFLLGYLNNKVILGRLYLGGYALNRTRLVVKVGRPHPLLILK